MKHILFLLTLCCVFSLKATEQNAANVDLPFGFVSASDIESLTLFAQDYGINLVAEIERAENGDDKALKRVFALSIKFDTMDNNCRTYGHLIYSGFLRGSESTGIRRYARVVAKQPKVIRQRIRDFIFFAVTLVPSEHREQAAREARSSAPLLFPNDYVFGSDNPLMESVSSPMSK